MDRIFYKSETVDAYTGYPIYVFDTSFLPSPDAINYDLFIPTMMRSLPDHPYVVVMLSGGLNKIQWIWGVKFLKSFLADSGPGANVENLQKVIAVHESWFVKSIIQILTNFSVAKPTLSKLNSLFDPKKNGKSLLTSCDSLGELSNYVDITKLKLSLNTYKHDANVTMSPKIPTSIPVDPIISDTTRFNPQSDPIFYHHFYQLFNIVDMYGLKVELLFHKPGNRLNTEILFLCMLRNQLLWINDWDLYCIASCFKKILMETPFPLLPVDLIELPMRDDLDYILVVFNHILAANSESGGDAVLFQCLDLCRKIVDNHETTRHTYVTILRSLCHALTHELISQANKDRITVAVHFIKSLLTRWTEIRPIYQKRFKTVSAVVNGDELNDATIDELYNMSHDITMEGNDSTEDESYHGHQNIDLLSSTSEVLLDTVHGNASNERVNSLPDLVSSAPPAPESRAYVPKGDNTNETAKKDQRPPKLPATSKSEISISTQVGTAGNVGSETSQSPRKTTRLNDVSNVQLQWPPQKYKFEKTTPVVKPEPTQEPRVVKMPVVRGRKVGELAKLFEERSQAMDLLRSM